MSRFTWPRRKTATADPSGTNGQIVAQSEGYTRPADAFRGSVALRRAMERPQWREDQP